tara:strand:- start:3717 stop:4100 length:384 start_codon:yes stop_codon:yes gene_type:complete
MKEISEFIRKHWKECSDWPDDKFLPWVEWNVGNGHCVVITEEGKVAGVAFARMVDDLTVHVDLAVGRSKSVLRALFTAGWYKFGRTKKWISWDRGKHGNRVVKKAMMDVAKKLMLRNGQKTKTTGNA